MKRLFKLKMLKDGYILSPDFADKSAAKAERNAINQAESLRAGHKVTAACVTYGPEHRNYKVNTP